MIKGYYVSGNTMVQELASCVKAIAVPIVSIDAANNQVNLDKTYIGSKKVLGFIIECLFDGDIEYVFPSLYNADGGYILCDFSELDGTPTKVTMLYLE